MTECVDTHHGVRLIEGPLMEIQRAVGTTLTSSSIMVMSGPNQVLSAVVATPSPLVGYRWFR
jgi:hypothetical protein